MKRTLGYDLRKIPNRDVDGCSVDSTIWKSMIEGGKERRCYNLFYCLEDLKTFFPEHDLEDAVVVQFKMYNFREYRELLGDKSWHGVDFSHWIDLLDNYECKNSDGEFEKIGYDVANFWMQVNRYGRDVDQYSPEGLKLEGGLLFSKYRDAVKFRREQSDFHDVYLFVLEVSICPATSLL